MNANATANLSSADVRYKTQADRDLADSLKILSDLRSERKRNRESKRRSNILNDVKEILTAAS
jgi:hypothetical protein